MDILCVSSQASTSICVSLDEAASSSSCSSSSGLQLGGRAIDRHNPIIRDTKRFNTNPLPSNQLRKKEKGSSSSSSSSSSSKSKTNDHKKKSFSSFSAKSNDQKKSSSKNSGSLKPTTDIEDAETRRRKSFSNGKAIDLVTPPGSTRYLLGDPGFFHGISDYDPVWSLVPAEESRIQAKKQDQTFDSKPSSDQVVVLRVSLHCKGCAGKVKKHLSRMEGVTSFNVDFAAKKVTVVGDVTPLSVLASVSKVKSAQFWTSETPAATKK